MTREGEAAVNTTIAICEELNQWDKRIEGRDTALFDHIRLTTVDILVWYFMPKLNQFMPLYPKSGFTRARMLSGWIIQAKIVATARPTG